MGRSSPVMRGMGRPSGRVRGELVSVVMERAWHGDFPPVRRFRPRPRGARPMTAAECSAVAGACGRAIPAAAGNGRRGLERCRLGRGRGVLGRRRGLRPRSPTAVGNCGRGLERCRRLLPQSARPGPRPAGGRPGCRRRLPRSTRPAPRPVPALPDRRRRLLPSVGPGPTTAAPHPDRRRQPPPSARPRLTAVAVHPRPPGGLLPRILDPYRGLPPRTLTPYRGLPPRFLRRAQRASTSTARPVSGSAAPSAARLARTASRVASTP